jgi:hypothetical protein
MVASIAQTRTPQESRFPYTASTWSSEVHMPAWDEQQERVVAVLVLDDCESGARAKRALSDAYPSSTASVLGLTLEAAPFRAMQLRRLAGRPPLDASQRATDAFRRASLLLAELKRKRGSGAALVATCPLRGPVFPP